MSTATTLANQRKRKRDEIPDSDTKRKWSNESPSESTGEHPQVLQLQEPKSRGVPKLKASTVTDDTKLMPGSSNTTRGDDHSSSEADLLNSELNTDSETTLDSGISSSESEDEEDEDEEEENSDRDSTVDEATISRDSLRDEVDTISIPPQTKPAIAGSPSPSGPSKLQSRIATFLPQLRKANEDLVNADGEMRIDKLTEGQDHYIEMDLGLGVLKERQKPRPPNREIQTHDSSTSSDSTSTSGDDTQTEGSGKDLMSDLLGKKKGGRQARPVIQPLDET